MKLTSLLTDSFPKKLIQNFEKPTFVVTDQLTGQSHLTKQMHNMARLFEK